ncbi:MAG: hypothetical protein ACTSRS_06375 [Candidatus Helarchaeota archaeon]
MRNYETINFVRGILCLIGGGLGVVLYLGLPFNPNNGLYQFSLYLCLFFVIMGGIFILIAREKKAQKTQLKEEDRSLLVWTSLFGIVFLVLFFINPYIFPPAFILGIILLEIGIYEIFLTIEDRNAKRLP